MSDIELQPIEAPRSLAEDAADRIREQILQGGFAQGAHLVESRIAQQLKVSRGPVREAFKLLRAEGLLQEEPRRGTFVVRMSPADVRDIYGLRAAIEGRAAKLIATAASSGKLREMRGLLANLENAVDEGDASAVFRGDLDFHEALCRLSDNRRLHEVFSRYVPTLRALLRLDERVYPSLDEIAVQHRPIVEAIETGDAEEAARLAEQHCDQAGDLIAAYIESLE
jgi:GntR family transcriptional regulator of gluconate operon